MMTITGTGRHRSGLLRRMAGGALIVWALQVFTAAIGAQAVASPCEEARQQGVGSVSIHCGGAPSATIDADGRLWAAFVQDQHVYVTHSDDLGESWSGPVAVNQEPEDAEHNGENRPKILIVDTDAPDDAGVVLVSWTTRTSSRFTGEIRFSRSTDGGRHFEAPRTINDDGLFTGHRFDSLFLTESGRLYLTWIDKRDLEASRTAGEPYAGAAIYYATSDDSGASFSPNYRVSHNSCECCRIAIAPHGDDRVAILWRQIYDVSVRDHAIAVLGPEGEVRNVHRATVDDWQINACPHHGPAMVKAEAENKYHVSWFSAGSIHTGIHYGLADVEGETGRIRKIDDTPGAGHPYLARHEGTLYLVWKGFNGTATQLRLITSMDEGVSWSEPVTLHETGEASDHPLLVTSGDGVYLAWSTDEFGYLFEALHD